MLGESGEARYSVHPIEPIGVELRGLDLAAGLDARGFETLRRTVLEHGLVLLRDQDLSPEQHVALGRRFGPLEGQEVTKSSPYRDVIMVSNVDPDGTIQPLTSPAMRVRAAVNRVWHTDSSFRSHPASLSIMHAIRVPPVGGATFYASLRRGWLDLDDAGRAALYGLAAVHDYAEGFRRAGQAIPESAGGSIEPVRHPLVRVHPETGQVGLYLSELAFGVEPLAVAPTPAPTPAEGRALLRRLIAVCTRTEVVYRHQWRERDLVLWDNRCMLHRAEGFDGRHARVLHHVRVSGDGPVIAAVP